MLTALVPRDRDSGSARARLDDLAPALGPTPGAERRLSKRIDERATQERLRGLVVEAIDALPVDDRSAPASVEDGRTALVVHDVEGPKPDVADRQSTCPRHPGACTGRGYSCASAYRSSSHPREHGERGRARESMHRILESASDLARDRVPVGGDDESVAEGPSIPSGEGQFGRELMISNAAARFDEHGHLVDETSRKLFRQLLEALLAWTRRLRKSS